ncbi:hypothetical protein [Nocardia sp. NPDC051570]|uniref:hypothetical protein n=1 Tax=Nocardia sp. NPDC051570 TaxID=3364324 RepID=UPI00379FCAFC
MVDLLAGTGAITGGIGGLTWWLWHDGPVRLIAGFVAVAHSDPQRRADAREVLRCTGRHRTATRKRAAAPARPAG